MAATGLAPGKWPVIQKTRPVTVSPVWVVWSVTNVSLATGAWTLRLALTTRRDVPVRSRARFFFILVYILILIICVVMILQVSQSYWSNVLNDLQCTMNTYEKFFTQKIIYIYSVIQCINFNQFSSHITIALYLHDEIWKLWMIFPYFPLQVVIVISLVRIAQIVTRIMANVCVKMGSKVTIVTSVKQMILKCPLMCVEWKVWKKIEIE